MNKSPVVYLSVLCLDAPVVAVAWQEALARASTIGLPAMSRLALFCTVWVIYLSDRLADSLTLSPPVEMSLRQRYVRRYRGLYAVALAGVVLIDLIIIPRLPHEIIKDGSVIATVALLYLVVNHFLSWLWRFVPIKESVVGFLFVAGVCVSLASPGAVFSNCSIWATILFALLCSLNCVSIAFWEKGIDLPQRRSSIATVCPRLSWLPLVGCSVVVTAAIALLFVFSCRPVWVCLALSGTFLAVLNFRSLPVSRDERTALADLVLLAPVLFIL